MCSVLTRDPYFLSIEQIADLTDYQLLQVYFRPQGERNGGGGNYEDPREIFRKVWERRGATAAEIAARWNESHPHSPWDREE